MNKYYCSILNDICPTGRVHCKTGCLLYRVYNDFKNKTVELNEGGINGADRKDT